MAVSTSAGRYPADPTQLIHKAAAQVGLDPELFRRLIMLGERSYKGWQSSPAGAFGPGQLMPGTASGLARQYHIDPNDYYGNLLGSAYYLRDMLKQFGGDARKAVAAYNAGPGNVQKYGGTPPFAETQRYVNNIFAGGWKPGQTNPSGAAPRPPTSVAAPGSFTAPSPLGRPPTPAAPTFNAGKALEALAGGGSIFDTLSQMVMNPARPKAAPARAKTVATVQTPPGAKNIPVQVTKGTKAGAEVQGIVALAEEYLGTPYSWGGGGTAGPSYGIERGAKTKGFDCSGFLQYLWYKSAGVDIGGTTYEQIKRGHPVGLNQLHPGDAIFFGTASDPHHVGMYIGNGKYIQAPKTGDVIKISNLSDRSDIVAARRYGQVA